MVSNDQIGIIPLGAPTKVRTGGFDGGWDGRVSDIAGHSDCAKMVTSIPTGMLLCTPCIFESEEWNKMPA